MRVKDGTERARAVSLPDGTNGWQLLVPGQSAGQSGRREVYCADKSARPSCCVSASLHKASFSEAVRGTELAGHGGIGWLIPDVAKIGP